MRYIVDLDTYKIAIEGHKLVVDRFGRAVALKAILLLGDRFCYSAAQVVQAAPLD